MFKMLFWLLRWFGVFLIGWLVPSSQQVMVDTPKPGEAVQGQVIIAGNVDLEGFQSYEVSFAYQKDETNTWFLIGRGEQIVRGGDTGNLGYNYHHRRAISNPGSGLSCRGQDC